MKRERRSDVSIQGDGTVIGALATGAGATATQSGTIVAGAPPAAVPAAGGAPEYRAVLVVDAAGFSDTTSAQQAEMSAGVVHALEAAFTRAGMAGAWSARRFRPRAHTGDGYIVGLSPEALPRLLHPFLRDLRDELRDRDRRRPADRARLRLRASVHVGPLPEEGVGKPMTDTFRLLDSEVLRNAMGPSSGKTVLAVIVSRQVYEEWVAAGHTDLDPSRFRKVLAVAKRFEQEAYLYVP